MHEIKSRFGGGYTLDPGRKVEFIKLPSGEFIRPINVEAIRVQPEKANAKTGEVSARVHIDHRGSWFTVSFASAEDAQHWADAFAELCNKIQRGDRMADEGGRELSRPEAASFLDTVRPRDPDAEIVDDEADE